MEWLKCQGRGSNTMQMKSRWRCPKSHWSLIYFILFWEKKKKKRGLIIYLKSNWCYFKVCLNVITCWRVSLSCLLGTYPCTYFYALFHLSIHSRYSLDRTQGWHINRQPSAATGSLMLQMNQTCTFSLDCWRNLQTLGELASITLRPLKQILESILQP